MTNKYIYIFLLAGFGNEYFINSENDEIVKPSNEGFLGAYKTVLNSKATEEALVSKTKIICYSFYKGKTTNIF